jgi:hypothetical protein
LRPFGSSDSVSQMIVIMDQQSHLALPLKNGFSARPFREASGDRRGVEGASLLRQRSRDPHRPRVKRSGPRGPGEAAPSSNASTISGASSVSRSTRLAAISPTMVCVFAVLRIADLERELRLRDERIANSRTRSIRGASWLIPGPTVRSRLDHRSHLLTRGMRPSISGGSKYSRCTRTIVRCRMPSPSSGGSLTSARSGQGSQTAQRRITDYSASMGLLILHGHLSGRARLAETFPMLLHFRV